VARDLASESKDYLPMEVDSETPVIKDHTGRVGVVGKQSQPNQKPVTFLSLGPSEDEKFRDDVKVIPDFYGNGQFWEPYVNRLRVFGTNEGVLKLPGKRGV